MASIELRDVSVSFPIFGTHTASLRRTFASTVTGGRIGTDTGVTIVEALRDITLELRDGDRLGVVGHNGAGKTTLLRTMAGVYPPQGGSCTRRGRVSSLIEPAQDIEPEATGYENIEMWGVLKGLSRAEIRQLLPDITEFSGLGDYLSMPVRTYSTGMLMRLAFAITTSVPADILLMDEWLAVGDADFKQQAERRLREVIDRTGILVLASHSPELIARECNRVIELSHGWLVRDGRLDPRPQSAGA
jgi:lipopolysaccharide transport system ATP-binding protein